jgi:Fur family ferric uptake transcriptional regulator
MILKTDLGTAPATGSRRYHVGVSPPPDDVHLLAQQRLRRIAQRYTGGRRALVQVLTDADGPLTIPEIVERGDGLALSSVYRNLATLEQAGIATRIVTARDHARYELAEPFGHHHHHLVCIYCGQVSDFTLPAPTEAALDAALRRVARKSGYEAEAHRLDLTGACPDCRTG